MPARISFFSLVAAGLVVAAQGPFTSSLVSDPDNPIPNPSGFTTIFTTVFTTVTTLSPPTTITLSPLGTTTTLLVSSLPPVTTTTTVFSSPPPSQSPSNEPTGIYETPMVSGTLVPLPTHRAPSPLTQNPGALAGLIIGVCVLATCLAVFTWFTMRQHRMRELENQALGTPPIGTLRYSTSAADPPLGHEPSRLDLDLEAQSTLGQEMHASYVGDGIGPSISGMLLHGDSPEQQPVDYETEYFKEPTVASSNGNSSLEHGTLVTRNSSLTQIANPRNISPTQSRHASNRPPRFSIGQDVVTMHNAWQLSMSEASTRRGSIDDASTGPHHPPRVNSDPLVFRDGNAPQLMMPSYHRRPSSELPRPETYQVTGPPILIHPASPTPPSSLLRAPSVPRVPTLGTIPQFLPSGVYAGLSSDNEPNPSPATSAVVLPERSHLLNALNHSSSNPPSLRDEEDYGRIISGGGVVGDTGDGESTADADSSSEMNPNRDRTQRR